MDLETIKIITEKILKLYEAHSEWEEKSSDDYRHGMEAAYLRISTMLKSELLTLLSKNMLEI